jgi:predicted nucleotidyltransferase component of viral defense system
MNSAVKTMLDRYSPASADDYENAVKEIIQEITLLGMWRAKFFEKAAFYGGTALRLLYGLDRFSEDIDFSLLNPDKNFNIDNYTRAVRDELSSFGFAVSVERKSKEIDTNIESAFMIIEAPGSIMNRVSKSKTMKVKIEVDIDPPPGFETEAKYLLNPIPFSVNTYSLPYLFAGKMHAVLCRDWKTRVKGRDWYDFVWYIGKNVPLNLNHLEKRLQQTGHVSANDSFTDQTFKDLLFERIETIDFEKAKQDVFSFLKDKAAVDVWSRDFFMEISKRIVLE